MVMILLRRISFHSAAGLALLLAALTLAGCGSLPTHLERPPSDAIPASPQTTLGQIARVSSPSPELTGFRLMPIGSFALNTRITLAQRAERSLDLQYYLVQDDQTGRYLLRALRDAAQRGVRVRLLMDDLYTSGEDELLRGLAAYPNVELRLFNPFVSGRTFGVGGRFVWSLDDFKRVNHRMHNKLFIADGAMAVAGGRNIADEYFMRSKQDNFVDLDTFITGALVPQLQGLFDQYWNSGVVYPVQSIVGSHLSRDELQQEFEAMTGPDHTPPPELPPANDVLGYGPIAEDLDAGRLGLIWATATAFADPPDIRVSGMAVSTGLVPLEDVDSVRYNVLEQMRGAKSEVVMTTPYLIPGEKGLLVMQNANLRGVKFRVLTNSLASTDEPLVHIGYMRDRIEMLKRGVELYELSPTRVQRNWKLGMFGTSHGRLHAKTAVIDRKTVFIGSMNFDPRSERHNTEMALIIQSPQLAREVLRLMDLDKLQASYHLVLTPDGEHIQWQVMDDTGIVTFDSEPDVSSWELLWLKMLAPLAPVEQL
jgi:putative cardiolipin synthase